MPLLPWLDSRKLCNAQQHVEGVVALSNLENLCTYLASSDGEVEVSLQFQRDEMGRAVAIGEVRSTNVEMICQRCLEIAPFMLQTSIHIAMVSTDEQSVLVEKESNNQLDAWVVGDGQLNLLQLLDQELVLSLPIVPYHKDCKIQLEYGKANDSEQKVNPFGVLTELLSKN